METDNKCINLSFKTWLNTITRCDLQEVIKILKWCPHGLDFLPSKLDANYNGWAKQGLSSYCTFFNKGTLSDFQTLKRPWVEQL